MPTPSRLFRPSASPHAQPPALPDWREYAGIVLERKWLALTVFAAVVTGTVIWNFRQVPRYQATARIQVDMSTENVLNIPDVVSMGEAGYMYSQYLNTQLIALRSRSFAEKAVRDLGPRLLKGLPPGTDAAGALLAFTSVHHMEDSRLIDVAAEHPDPALAADMANAVAETFVQQNLERRMSASMEAVDWLRKQAEDVKLKLLASEKAVQEYSEKNGLITADSAGMAAARLTSLNQELTAAETVRFDAESEWNKIRELDIEAADLAMIGLIAAGMAEGPARDLILNRQAEIALLAQRYKLGHPAMQKAWGELREACRGAKAQIEARFSLAKAKETRLREAVRQQELTAVELNRKLVEYNQLQRVAEADKQLYDTIITRMKEAGVAGKLETNNMRIIDRARVPASPFKPRPAANTLRAVGAGAILALLLCFVVHVADDRVKRLEDIVGQAQTPALGFVPRIPRRHIRRGPVVQLAPDSPGAEAFRTLRTTLSLGASTREARALLITSTGPSEGKTLVAANLGAALALNNVRTLVVDVDLRRPALHRRLGVTAGHGGLTEVLEGSLPWRQAVCETAIPLLHLVPAGRIPPNPSELLGLPAMLAFLREALQEYDRVILDGTPLGGLSDAMVLMPNVDNVILVARFRRTHRRAFLYAIQKLRLGEVPVGGVVLNDADTSRFGGYYGYYHRHYGYHEYRYRTPPSGSGKAASGPAIKG